MHSELSSALISRVAGDSGVDASQATIPEFLQARAQRIENGLEIGDPTSPKVGNLRITFTQAPQQEVSLVARQVQDIFEPYPTRSSSVVISWHWASTSLTAWPC